MSDVISTREALDELLGTTCHGCNRHKAIRMSHCRRCYSSLPKTLQRRLYNRVGAGYEEAYTESLTTLRAKHKLPVRVFA